jgi:hypothetical protein
MKKHAVYLLVILFVSLFSLKALFQPGLFTAHDIWHNLARLYYYQKAVTDGQFPAYFINTLANNLGYPLFFFSYHLPWLFGLIFLKLGLSLTQSIKALFFISYLLSGLTMYFFSYSLFKKRLAAFLTAFLYLWVPYHFLIIFVSAAMGIAFAFTFLPLIFWGIYLSGKKPILSIILTSFGLSGLILSHITSLIVALPTIAIFISALLITNKNRKPILKSLGLGAIFGLAISSFYFVPAIYYAQTIHGLGNLYSKGFVNLSQLIYSKWGYGIITTSAKEAPFSLQLGIAQWLATFGLILALVRRKGNLLKIPILLIMALLINIFLMLDPSKFIWDLFAPFLRIDFPFRFLLPSLFVASLLAGYLSQLAPKPLKLPILTFLILVALYTNRNHLEVNMYVQPSFDGLIASEITTNTYHEYTPSWADIGLINVKNQQTVFGNVEVKSVSENTKQTRINLVSKEKQQITINKFYYPYLGTYVDGQKVSLSKNKSGLIEMNINKGKNEILVELQEPIVVKAGKIISIAGLIGALLLIKRSVA